LFPCTFPIFSFPFIHNTSFMPLTLYLYAFFLLVFHL
jgi:hypothetical protein